jgi:hypothetical protein
LHSATLDTNEICPDQADEGDPSDTPQHGTDPGEPGANDDHSNNHPGCQKYNSSSSATPKNSHDLPLPPCPTLSTGSTITVHAPHGNALTILIVLLSLVLCVALLIVLWRVCVAVKERCIRRKQARYKSVSKFFPFTYGQDTSNGVAILEYGLPKNRAAEREILLNDSDEDEL